MNKNIENDIKLYAEDLCKNLRKWKSDKKYQTWEIAFQIHSDANQLENDYKKYSNPDQINFGDLFKRYSEFKIEDISNFKWCNNFCISTLIKGSEADSDLMNIRKGGI